MSLNLTNTIGPLTTTSVGISVNGNGKFSGNVTIGNSSVDGTVSIQSGHLFSATNTPLVLDSFGTMYFRNITTANQITTFTDSMNLQWRTIQHNLNAVGNSYLQGLSSLSAGLLITGSQPDSQTTSANGTNL